MSLNCPLPNARSVHSLPPHGNRGLYFNKFFDQWKHRQFDDLVANAKIDRVDYYGGKANWLLSQYNSRSRNDGKFRADGIDARSPFPTRSGEKMAGRIKNLAKANGGEGRNFISTGPLVTGMGLEHPVENGFLWHHTLGVPYIPGSSVKGMIRAWAAHWEGADKQDIYRLFGRSDKLASHVGGIVVFDALPVSEVTLYTEVMTPHDGGWRIAEPTTSNAPADWKSPVPIPFLAVKAGTTFQFALAKRTEATDDRDLRTAWKYLTEALEWIGIGAKTAVGFGRFMKKTKWDKEEKKREGEKIAIKAAEEQRKAEIAKLPKQHDRVRVTAQDNRYFGRTGVINRIVVKTNAQITPDDDKGKIKGTIPLTDLEKIDP